MVSHKTKLKSCNLTLPVATFAILVSGIQLEAISGNSIPSVWIHIIIGLSFFALILWHIRLHSKYKDWPKLLWRRKPADMKWLTVSGLLTLLTAVIATAGWLESPDHSRIGAVHGKLGFLMTAIAIWHIARRISFYRNIMPLRASSGKFPRNRTDASTVRPQQS